MVRSPRLRAVASTLCALRIALFFSICRQRFLPQTPFGSQTLFCQCSISNAASGDTRLAMFVSFPGCEILTAERKQAKQVTQPPPARCLRTLLANRNLEATHHATSSSNAFA